MADFGQIIIWEISWKLPCCRHHKIARFHRFRAETSERLRELTFSSTVFANIVAWQHWGFRGGSAQTTVDVWCRIDATLRVTLICRYSDDIRERVEVALPSHCGEQRSGFNRILHVHSLARASKDRERR